MDRQADPATHPNVYMHIHTCNVSAKWLASNYQPYLSVVGNVS